MMNPRSIDGSDHAYVIDFEVVESKKQLDELIRHIHPSKIVIFGYVLDKKSLDPTILFAIMRDDTLVTATTHVAKTKWIKSSHPLPRSRFS